MSIEKIVLKMATHYHANLIDIHNALHALGWIIGHIIATLLAFIWAWN